MSADTATLTLTYAGPFAAEKAPLYERYQGQTNAQPAYLQLDPGPGVVSFGTCAEIGGGMPVDVYHQRLIRWSCPNTLTGAACEELFEKLEPLLQRVAAGHSEEWNGSNMVGRFTPDAMDASEEIGLALYPASGDLDGVETAEVWIASDWLYAGQRDEDLARQLEITRETTDEALEAIAADLAQQAEADGIVLDGDLARVLRDLRDRLPSGEDE